MNKKKFISKQYLVISYGIVLLLFLYFIISSWQDLSATSIIINLGMLVIAAVIYIYSYRKFEKVDDIEDALLKAKEKIVADFDSEKTMLWNIYRDKENEDELFYNTSLSSEYQSYVREMKRLELLSKDGFKCEISDYINRSFIDDVINKSVLNLVSGAMTGLGILGTFIGLSFGLQHFNTGSSAEIAESIAPLMSGIKVAFHTSIFGMILSLFFNYAYKLQLVQSYHALDEFLKIFNCYVVSNSENDYYNQMLISIPDAIGNKIATLLKPHFIDMTATIKSYTEHMLANQIDGVDAIVDKFIEEMNRSLCDKFNTLGDSITIANEIQKENNMYTKNNIESMQLLINNIMEIHGVSKEIIASFQEYIGDIKILQNGIHEQYKNMTVQLENSRLHEEKMQEYMHILVEYEKNIQNAATNYSESIVSAIEQLGKLENDIIDYNKENLKATYTQVQTCVGNLSDLVETSLKKTEELSSKQMQTIAEQAEQSHEQFAMKATEQMQLLSETGTKAIKNMKCSTESIVKFASKTLDVTKTMALNNINALSSIAEQHQINIANEAVKKISELDSLNEDVSKHIKTTTEEISAVTANHMENVKVLSSKSIEQLSKQAEEQYSAFSKLAEKQFEQLLQKSAATSTDMEHASHHLSEAANNLNTRLESNLTGVFNLFDQELGKIATHLGGTIEEINSTTERSSMIIATVYDNIQDILSDMEEELKNYVHTVAEMQEEVKNTISEIQHQIMAKEEE